MKRLTVIALVYASMLLGVFIAQAAPVNRLLFPTIANGAPQPRLIKLIDHDAGAVNAVATPDCRYFVDWQSRPDGTVYATEHIGDRLVPRAVAVVSATAVLAPQASDLPGPKQGSVSQVVCGGELRTYFTGRAEGEPSGPFFVWVLIEPIPPLVKP